MVPRRLLQAEQPEPRPVVQTLTLRPGPGAQAAPALQRFGRRQFLGRHLDRPLAGDQRPQRLGRLDRQHMRSVVLLEPDAQPAVVAIDLVAQHPGDRHPGREGTLDHALRQSRLGGELDVLRYGGRGAALPVVGPFLGQIQFAVDQGVALCAGVGQENTDLTVLDPLSLLSNDGPLC